MVDKRKNYWFMNLVVNREVIDKETKSGQHTIPKGRLIHKILRPSDTRPLSQTITVYKKSNIQARPPITLRIVKSFTLLA